MNFTEPIPEIRPLGLYHPNPSLHHIKKENIGLIEVMGLAVLPARLANELEAVRQALLSGEPLDGNPLTQSHAEWADELLKNHPEFNADNAMDIIHAEVGAVAVLAGLYIGFEAQFFKQQLETA